MSQNPPFDPSIPVLTEVVSEPVLTDVAGEPVAPASLPAQEPFAEQLER